MKFGILNNATTKETVPKKVKGIDFKGAVQFQGVPSLWNCFKLL